MQAAKQQPIANALANFDQLPDSAHVPQGIVTAVLGISGPTLWRRVKDGTLPAPRKPSPGCTRWVVGELRQAMAKA